MIADEVIPCRSVLDLKYPIREGIIKDNEELELLWKYAIHQKIGISQDKIGQYNCIITEAPINPFKNKEIMASTILEKIGVAGFNIEPQAKLTLVSLGQQSGLVVDSGDGVSHCIPVIENQIDHHNISRLDVAGRHVTEYLIRLL